MIARLPTALICAAVCVAAALAGCGSTNSANTATGAGGTQQLTVYSSLPLAGGLNTWAMSMVDGEKLALAQARGRIGPFRVSFYSEDDALASTRLWDPGQTSTNARMAAQDHSTIAYLGDWDSGAAAVSLPLMNASGIPQVSPAASYPGLTRATFAGKGEPDRYYPSGKRSFVRLVPGDDVQAAALLSYLRREHVRSIYAITDQDVFDADAAEILAALAPGHGIRVLGKDSIGASDVPSEIRRAAGSGAGAVVFAGRANPMAQSLIAGLAHRAPHLKVFIPYATAQPAMLARLGHAAAVLHVTSPIVPVAMYRGAALDFALAYRRQFGSTPDPWGIYGYESMRLVLDAIRAAGTAGADHQAIITRLLTTRNRLSALGTYSLDSNGDTTLHRYAGYRVGRGGVLLFQGLLDTTPL